MRLLAESSAVVTWLLNEPRSAEVAALLGSAQEVVTSNLTWIECHRVLHRHAALGARPPSEIQDSQDRLAQAARCWISIEITAECQRRASSPFPVEPLRTLDALHLATAQVARQWIEDLKLLSLDQRIRQNAQAMGFEVVP